MLKIKRMTHFRTTFTDTNCRNHFRTTLLIVMCDNNVCCSTLQSNINVDLCISCHMFNHSDLRNEIIINASWTNVDELRRWGQNRIGEWRMGRILAIACSDHERLENVAWRLMFAKSARMGSWASMVGRTRTVNKKSENVQDLESVTGNAFWKELLQNIGSTR